MVKVDQSMFMFPRTFVKSIFSLGLNKQSSYDIQKALLVNRNNVIMSMEQSVIRHNRSKQDHFEVTRDIYHPQTKFAKVMFSHLSVSHSVHRGSVSVHAGIHPPGGEPPRPGTPLGPAPPPGPGTPNQAPPGSRHPPLHSVCCEVWSTSEWYASYWNAIIWLLNINNQGCQG